MGVMWVGKEADIVAQPERAERNAFSQISNVTINKEPATTVHVHGTQERAPADAARRPLLDLDDRGPAVREAPRHMERSPQAPVPVAGSERSSDR